MNKGVKAVVIIIAFLAIVFLPVIISSLDSEPTDKFLSEIKIEENGSIIFNTQETGMVMFNFTNDRIKTYK